MTATAAKTFSGDVREDCPATVLHRFCAISGTGAASPDTSEGNLITQADTSSVAVKVFDGSGTQVLTTLAPSVSSVIYDTLQTSGTWGNLIEGGYTGGNFRYTIPATYFSCGGDILRVEIMVTLSDGTILPAVWSMTVLPLIGS